MKPTVVRNPATDPDFDRAIDEMLDRGVTDPAVFEASLRDRFPRVIVRPRELAGEDRPIWYAYRDGHWTGGG
jgi:hypothetical protein